MQLRKEQLYRIVLEEYLKEENITEIQPHVLDLLRKIKGEPEYDPRDDPGSGLHDPIEPNTPSDTQTMDRPARTAPDPEETFSFEEPADSPHLSADELAATIGELIYGRDPEEVAEIFQMAFEQLPGVELTSPGEEDAPPTEYGGEEFDLRDAQGRLIGPRESLQLEELIRLIEAEMTGEEYAAERSAEAGEPPSDPVTIAREVYEAGFRVEEGGNVPEDTAAKIMDVMADHSVSGGTDEVFVDVVQELEELQHEYT